MNSAHGESWLEKVRPEYRMETKIDTKTADTFFQSVAVIRGLPKEFKASAQEGQMPTLAGSKINNVKE